MPRYFALMPAAGSGSRMAGQVPKQYLEVAGRPLLDYALASLCAHGAIEQVFVVLAQGDDRFAGVDWTKYAPKLEPLYCGGQTRAASVFNGLLAARDAIASSDWVLVHDAARPCLRAADLARLIDEVGDDETGGLLAIPVSDTLKRADRDGRAVRTEPREHLWRAQTPQMFRYCVLLEALRVADAALVTDEAQAIEALGLRPKIVMGDARNIKVTFSEDLALAGSILQNSAVAHR